MKKLILFILILVTFTITGCTGGLNNINLSKTNTEAQSSEDIASLEQVKMKKIAESYRDIYEHALAEGTIASLDTKKCIVKELGDIGYVTVDADNKIDMVHADQVMDFIEKAQKKQYAQIEIVSVTQLDGFIFYDLKTKNGKLEVTATNLTWNEKNPEPQDTKQYEAYYWSYTEEGYFLFEDYHMPGYDGPNGHMALRVQPLDQKCRDLCRKYIDPVNYSSNDLFITNWDEHDYGDLDFYDLFDALYTDVYSKVRPYFENSNLGIGSVYHIPKQEFEKVVMTYFNISEQELRKLVKYNSEDETYEYRPRGLHDAECPVLPYPEVIDYVENADGTISLTVRAVFPEMNSSNYFTHEVVVRPLQDGSFQYVSNHFLSPDNAASYDDLLAWHQNRLTEAEWNQIYGESK